MVARGNERKAIFRDDRDRETYLARLAQCRERFGFFLYAYCLMGNHVHLALERGSFPLSRIMLSLQSFYSQRFNRRHERVGHLFQGRYGAFLVQKERYLLALLQYIHFNPVKAGLVKRPEEFRWCSARYYRVGKGPDWLDQDRALQLLGRRSSQGVVRHRRFVGRSTEPSYEDVEAFGRAVKGEEDFAARSLTEAGGNLQRWSIYTIEQVAGIVASAERLSLRDLQRPGRSARESQARSIAAYLGRVEARIAIAQMARYFERDESTLVKGVQRLEAALAVDRDLRSHVSAIASTLKADKSRMQV